MREIEISLIGIGTGNPDHITLQGIKAINVADLILIPLKGAEKDDLAGSRRQILGEVLQNAATQIAEITLPVRDAANPDYRAGVDDWHDAIAACWHEAIAAHPSAQKVALLIWGDPSLYDSALRIAGRLPGAPKTRMIPGITAIQALTASHAIPLNQIGAPVVITTGRRLRDHGFPPGADTAVVMLDGGCAFQTLPQADFDIWWGAYVGMEHEILRHGPLDQAGPDIIDTRAKARAQHGWLMDIYLLRRR